MLINTLSPEKDRIKLPFNSDETTLAV